MSLLQVTRCPEAARAHWSVSEMPGPGEVQRDTGPGGGGRHLVVTHGAAGVHDRLDAGVGQQLESVGDGKERSRGRHRALDAGPAAPDSQPRGVDAVDLTHADADGRTL